MNLSVGNCEDKIALAGRGAAMWNNDNFIADFHAIMTVTFAVPLTGSLPRK